MVKDILLMRTAHTGKQQAYIHVAFEISLLWILNRKDCAEEAWPQTSVTGT